jgi:beta-lactamase class D
MKKVLLPLGALLSVIVYSCSSGDVTTRDDWGAYFSQEKVQGCFMLFDNGHTHVDVYNLPRTQQRFLPASTFKIMKSLVGLETGVISDTSMVIKWDSVVRKNKDWNEDLTMGQAFRVSAVPYYQKWPAVQAAPSCSSGWIQ